MLISVESWILFSIFFFIYIWVKRSTRTAMLLYVTAFSLFYYFRFNGVLGLVLLPATALVNYLLVERMRRGDRKKLFLSLTILADLGVLAYFKYAGFFVEGILNPLLGSNFDIGRIAVPVGISFYTFQAISYAVDVYRGRFTLRPDFLEYLFYLSFFPLLLAGPITRAETLFPQMRENRPADRRDVWGGFYLIISGLLKKGVIADYIAQYNNFVFGSPGTFSALECFLAIVGFTIQIYYDFSGYSDISIGIASMMGFRLKDNFRMPYRSLNLTDFWRRWHISLSSWFRDYLYIPLGGNRKGTFRTMLNNFLTMLVAGIWHGASWMFIIWGGLHGLGLVVHKSCRKFLSRIPDNVFTKGASWLLTMAFVSFAWVFFKAESMDGALQMLSRTVGEFDLSVLPFFLSTRPLLSIVLVAACVLNAFPPRFYGRLKVRFIYSEWWVKLLAFVVVVQLILQMQGDEIQPFIYFQF